MMVGCGNKSSDGAVSESDTVGEETVQEVKTYVKGDTFELEGCTFTIDDIIMNVCAILISTVNNSDEEFEFKRADFYEDNFLCEMAYASGTDERLDGYIFGHLEVVEPGKGVF